MKNELKFIGESVIKQITNDAGTTTVRFEKVGPNLVKFSGFIVSKTTKKKHLINDLKLLKQAGLNCKEIATISKISPSYVQKLLRR